MTNEIFGVAMSLFHYYTYYKSLKEIDRAEISVACVFLACKIEYSFLKVEESNEIFFQLKTAKTSKGGLNSQSKIHPPDYAKLEMEILSFIGFEMGIETPYRYFYQTLYNKFPNLYKDEGLKNFSLKVLNDTYRKPLSLFYSHKYIALAVLFIIINTQDGINFSINDLILIDKGVNFNMLVSCVENVVSMFEVRTRSK